MERERERKSNIDVDARCVMVTVVGNGPSNPSSNLGHGFLHFT